MMFSAKLTCMLKATCVLPLCIYLPWLSFAVWQPPPAGAPAVSHANTYAGVDATYAIPLAEMCDHQHTLHSRNFEDSSNCTSANHRWCTSRDSFDADVCLETSHQHRGNSCTKLTWSITCVLFLERGIASKSHFQKMREQSNSRPQQAMHPNEGIGCGDVSKPVVRVVGFGIILTSSKSKLEKCE